MAAMTKLIRIAYLRFLRGSRASRCRACDRSVITTGVSNTTPKASVNFRMKSSVAAGDRDHGLEAWSWPKLTRKVIAKGTTTSVAKAPPPMKSSEPMMTKGAAYLRSCLCRPGATKAQTS